MGKKWWKSLIRVITLSLFQSFLRLLTIWLKKKKSRQKSVLNYSKRLKAQVDQLPSPFSNDNQFYLILHLFLRNNTKREKKEIMNYNSNNNFKKENDLELDRDFYSSALKDITQSIDNSLNNYHHLLFTSGNHYLKLLKRFFIFEKLQIHLNSTFIHLRLRRYTPKIINREEPKNDFDSILEQNNYQNIKIDQRFYETMELAFQQSEENEYRHAIHSISRAAALMPDTEQYQHLTPVLYILQAQLFVMLIHHYDHHHHYHHHLNINQQKNFTSVNQTNDSSDEECKNKTENDPIKDDIDKYYGYIETTLKMAFSQDPRSIYLAAVLSCFYDREMIADVFETSSLNIFELID